MSVRLAIAATVVLLANLGYYTMAGVFTSLNGEVGFVVFGILWLSLFVCQILIAAPFVNAFGPRVTVAVGNALSAMFVVLNYYQSWPTLIISGVCEGAGSALRWTGIYHFVNVEVVEFADRNNKPVERYASIFNSILLLSYFLAKLIGSAISTAFLLPTQPSVVVAFNKFSNFTDTVSNSSVSFTNGSSQDDWAIYSGCLETSGVFEVPTWAYYSLITTAAVLTASSVLLSFCLGSMKLNCSSRPCTTLQCNPSQAVKSLVVKYYKPVFRVFFRARYVCVLPIAFLSGQSEVLFYGTFSRHFVSECLGLGVVGLVVVTLGIGASLSSLSLGKISLYISRSLVAVLAALLQAGMILFMLFWQREPSYVMVFLTSLGWGIVNGVWMTLPAIYISVVAKPEEAHSAFALNIASFSLGGAISFFYSAYLREAIVLWILLTVLVAANVIYFTGEKVYASSRKEKPDVFDCNESTSIKECNSTRKTSLNHGTCRIITNDHEVQSFIIDFVESPGPKRRPSYVWPGLFMDAV